MSLPQEESLWSAVNTFTTSHRELGAVSFQPYDYAIRLWRRERQAQQAGEGESEFRKHKQAKAEAAQLTDRVAQTYGDQFEAIARAFVHKSQVTENIEKTLKSSLESVEKTKVRFKVDPTTLVKVWRKCVKYQKEIDIFTQIEILVSAPTVVWKLIEQEEILAAVNHIQNCFKSFEENQMKEITALADVKARLDTCKGRVTDRFFEVLMNELFIAVRPPGVSFLPKQDCSVDVPEIDTHRVRNYVQALVGLEEQERFIEHLRASLPGKLAEMMTKTAEGIKGKQRRAFSEPKDSFAEFVQIYQAFTPTNPLVLFLDSALCKIWVLMEQCRAIDNFLQGRTAETLQTAWKSAAQEIQSFIEAFTVSSAKKVTGPMTLTYKFLSTDTTPTKETYTELRQKMGIKPSEFNVLLLFPLISSFKKLVEQQFKMTDAKLGVIQDKSLEKQTEDLIDQKAHYRLQFNTNNMKTDLHDVPIFANTVTYVENIGHFIKAAEKFVTLQANMERAATELIKAFRHDCQTEFNKANHETLRTYKLLESARHRYAAQPIVKQIIFEGHEDFTEDELNEFYAFEDRNERDLLNGNVTVSVEETLRERFYVPKIATTIESLIVLQEQITKLLDESPFKNSPDSPIRKALAEVEQTIIQAMCFLHVEMHVKCYAEICPALMNANYKLQSVPTMPDSYASRLAATCQDVMDWLSPFLMPNRLLFVFLGLPRLIYLLHMKFVPRVREINDKGAEAVTKNMDIFRQTFGSFKYPDMKMYSKSHWFVSRIAFSSERILNALRANSTKYFFTYDEVAPAIQMQQKANESQAEVLEALKDLLGD